MRTSGIPSSAVVGTSANIGCRRGPVWARTRSAPPSATRALASPSDTISICPGTVGAIGAMRGHPPSPAPSSFVGWPSARVHFVEQTLHAPAQAVHLIDEMQDDRDAFIVDAEVLTQIANELGAREVDVGEHQL